jgi:hypothetical protein
VGKNDREFHLLMEYGMSILDTLDDCIIYSGHERHQVRANTFVLVQNCEIFKMAYEDMIEEGSREFTAPNVSGRIMQILVNLIHKKIQPSDIVSIDDILDVFEAMRYLQCGYKKSKLANQLWELVRALPVSSSSMDVMIKTAPQLVESHPREFLSKARVVSKMRFDSYRRVFDAVDMTPELAKTCMQESMAHFSPLLMLHCLVHVTPHGLKFHTVLECLTLYRVGNYFHPDEFMLALQMLGEYRSMARREIPHYVIDLAKTTLDACHDVNTPQSSSTATGSLVTIEGKPRASFFLRIHRHNRKIRMPFQHNVAHIHRDGHVLECRFLLGKLGEFSHAAPSAHVRIVYIPEVNGVVAYDKAHEDWIHVTTIQHDEYDAIDIRNEYAGDVVTYIRIDLFWMHDPANM